MHTLDPAVYDNDGTAIDLWELPEPTDRDIILANLSVRDEARLADDDWLTSLADETESIGTLGFWRDDA